MNNLELTYQQRILSEASLVAFWRLNETTGTVAVDSKSGINGTYNNCTLNKIGAVAGGKSALFNGTTSYVSIPANAALNLIGQITLECWARLGPVFHVDSQYSSLITKGFDGTTLGYQLSWESYMMRGGSYVAQGNANYGAHTAYSKLQLSGWYHCVTTYDGSVWQNYINGVPLGAAVAGLGPQATGENLKIGAMGLVGTVQRFTQGNIAEVAIYNTALSATAIYEHHLAALSQQQVDYVNRKFGAFLHFGLETFTGVEYTDGTVDKNVFSPASLDVPQWLDTIKNAGMKYAVLTAKHHSGFCLWPSATTTYDSPSTTWGIANPTQADIVSTFTTQARTRGLAVGLYFSTWDKKFELENPGYTAQQYIDYLKSQLTELLSNYGQIDILWFDGTWNPSSNYNVINNAQLVDHVKSLQPNCVLVQNNHDHELSHSEIDEYEGGGLQEGMPAANNLLPAELCDTIRADAKWFWGPETTNKSATALLETLSTLNSRNCAYLLNLPPDLSGRVPVSQTAILAAVGESLLPIIPPTPSPSMTNFPQPSTTQPGGAFVGNLISAAENGPWVNLGAITGEATTNDGGFAVLQVPYASPNCSALVRLQHADDNGSGAAGTPSTLADFEMVTQSGAKFLVIPRGTVCKRWVRAIIPAGQITGSFMYAVAIDRNPIV